MKVSSVVLALVLLVGAGHPAFADTISPATFSATLGVGGTTSITKTVTITPQATAPIDIVFLTDTTGSMGSTIDSIRTGFTNIVTSINGVASNVAYGVAEYKDVVDAFAYRENTDLTTSNATVQSAMSQWSAGGGGDLPEANLYGLQQTAVQTTWRAGSDRFVVWVGDAPGHDPSNGVTQAGAIAALNAVNASVFAANAPTGGGLNSTGQATAITGATGGSFLGTFDASSITAAITAALTTSISTYNSVSLVAVGLPAGVSLTLSPAITGSFDRTIARTFNFTVDFTGVAPGVYNFSINTLLNGTNVVATETDTITVTGTGPPVLLPASSSYTLLVVGLVALSLAGLGRYKRERGAKLSG